MVPHTGMGKQPDALAKGNSFAKRELHLHFLLPHEIGSDLIYLKPNKLKPVAFNY